jgi:hypothetical protein
MKRAKVTAAVTLPIDVANAPAQTISTAAQRFTRRLIPGISPRRTNAQRDCVSHVPQTPDVRCSFLQISATLFCHTCPFYGVSVKIVVGHLSPTRGGYLEGWITWQAPLNARRGCRRVRISRLAHARSGPAGHLTSSQMLSSAARIARAKARRASSSR